jgi:glycosyltransferase involved in cell wall biosynthesis
MSADLPVVTSDLPVFREYLTPGRDALLVPVGDDSGLATALLAVLQEEDLRERLTAGGRRLVRRFTWAESARRHLEVYAGLQVRALSR